MYGLARVRLHSADALIVARLMRASRWKASLGRGKTKERLPAFNGLTTYRRDWKRMMIGDRPDATDRTCVCVLCSSLFYIKIKTYASLKPLTCSILICLTMVLLPDSPAPETDVAKISQIVSSPLPFFPLNLRYACKKNIYIYFTVRETKISPTVTIIDRSRDNISSLIGEKSFCSKKIKIPAEIKLFRMSDTQNRSLESRFI